MNLTDIGIESAYVYSRVPNTGSHSLALLEGAAAAVAAGMHCQ